jgi:hypothetical protein
MLNQPIKVVGEEISRLLYIYHIYSHGRSSSSSLTELHLHRAALSSRPAHGQMQIDVPQGMMPMVKVWKSCRGNDAVIDRVFWEHEWRGVEWRRNVGDPILRCFSKYIGRSSLKEGSTAYERSEERYTVDVSPVLSRVAWCVHFLTNGFTYASPP